MASNELIRAFESYKNYYAGHGTDEKLIEACIEAGKTAFKVEEDAAYGLQITAETKKYINELVYQKTGAGFFDLEKYAMERELDYDILNSGYDVYRLESFSKFESYMLYMERDRWQHKRFYLPRRNTLRVVANDMQRLEDDELDVYGLSMPSRVGKLIADDVPVMTRQGWKNHGDLTIGDEVVGLNGEFIKVTHVFPKNQANVRVHFTDHTYVDCHENHEWLVYDRSRNKEKIVETKELANSAYQDNGHERYRYQLPIIEAIKGENKDLAVDPYVLGAWIGDGTTSKPCLTICHTDTCIANTVMEKYPCTSVIEQVGCNVYSFEGLRADLKKLGMCQSNNAVDKFIPQEYLIASKYQRLELLAGLLDTDGSLRKKEHRYEYSTINENIKESIVTLISSFGWRVSVTTYNARTSSSGIIGKHDVYRIAFNPTEFIPCRVERKQLREFSKQKRIGIVGIESIKPRQGNCISVEGGIYRVGERLKPTHNSTICVMFLTWVGLRKPDSHNAMGGHSGQLAKRFFRGLDNIIEQPEYKFAELFKLWNPEFMNVVQAKSSDPAEFTINLGSPDEFATYTCRGIDGTWTGAVDVSSDGYLYVDDLVRDREHSLSPSRMENTYQEYQNKMLDRMNDGAKKVLVGTLWSVIDPLERERKQNEGNPRALFRKIPALDENEQSNFQYKVKGFSTQYYIDMRSRLDKAEWMAKYQQQPFVREGLTYPIEELKFFDGTLPDGNCRTVAHIDVAFGGGDSVSMPVCKDFDETGYIVGWVHDSRSPGYTVPKVVDAIERYFITLLWIEKNSGGQLYADKITEEMTKRGITHCKIELYSAPNRMSKEDKITGYSDYVKRKFYFLHSKARNIELDEEMELYYADADYRKAMDEMTTWSAEAKGRVHDDSPDSISSMGMKMDARKSYGTRIIASPI